MKSKHPKVAQQDTEAYVYRNIEDQYTFSCAFHEKPHGFEIDLLKLPQFKGRNDGWKHSYWNWSPRGGKMIYFTPDAYPKTLLQARQVAIDYFQFLSCYLNSGYSFDELFEIRDKTLKSKNPNGYYP